MFSDFPKVSDIEVIIWLHLASLIFFLYYFQRLLKTEEHSWSLAELIHAVVLLTHYHSLASFTFGCGITPEIHCDGGHTFRPPSLSQLCVCDIANGNGHANHHDDVFGNQVSGKGWCGWVCVCAQRETNES